jgi:hypothetical protein
MADPGQQCRHQDEEHCTEDLQQRSRCGPRRQLRAERPLQREAQQPPQPDVLKRLGQPRVERLEEIGGQWNGVG